ncbi:MAG: phosphopantetheine-binding protein [Pseudomonadota bacterium]|nr:phosphopantetheine-binding protein [Pseudomonadota bacterium]
MTVESAESVLMDYLREKAPEGIELGPDVDLIDERVVDSLGFLNFIFMIEELVGAPIPMDAINVDDFRTLRRIREKFLVKLA